MINYTMLHYNNLKYACYKPSCMRYIVTNHHNTSCFLVPGGYASLLLLMAARYLLSYKCNFLTTNPDIFVVYTLYYLLLAQPAICHSSLPLLPNQINSHMWRYKQVARFTLQP